MTLTKKCVEEAVEKEIEVCVISGVEGNCLSINYRRVAGAKPWGGGKIITKWNVTVKDIIEAFPEILSLAQAYISGELRVMASEGELRVIISTILQENMRDKKKITETISRLAKALVGKIASVGRVEEPRGAQFRRVEEQQKVIERYRLALEKLARLGNGNEYGNSDGNCIAQEALKELK